MHSDRFGNPIFDENDLINLIYQGKIDVISSVYTTPNISKELELQEHKELDLPVGEFDKLMQENWFIPNEYKTFDIEQWVRSQCPPWDPESSRVDEELAEFRARNMLPLLRVLKYIVDTLRSQNILWGVGRGSSVASYVLYLIGVHKIDSIKYNLDWREFLR